MSQVSRWVRWYDGDVLAGEVRLHGFDLASLRLIVSAPSDDLLYDCWSIPQDRMLELALFGSVPAVSDRFAYFLEADNEPDAASNPASY